MEGRRPRRREEEAVVAGGGKKKGTAKQEQGDGTEDKTCRKEGGRSTLDLTNVHGGVPATGGSLMDLERYPASSAVCHWRGLAQGGPPGV